MAEDGVIGHDSPLDQTCRVYASIAFAVLLLGIGLPLWWHTTEVPRVKLPYQGIYELDELRVRIHLNLYLGCLEIQKCELLARELMARLTDDGQLDIMSMTITNFATNGSSIGRSRNLADMNDAASRFKLNTGDVLVLETPFAIGDDLVHVNSGRAVFFDPEAEGDKIAQVIRRWLLRDGALSLTRDALTDPTEHTLDVENRRRFPASANYDVLLTVINPDPDKMRVDREFARTALDYVEPFLHELAPIAEFSVKTQWLYLLELATTHPGRPYYVLDEDRLPQIITPLESKLASQVSLHPTINLVAYMVPCSGAPLYIYGRNGSRINKDRGFEAFHSPRWGGIALVNPPDEYCKRTAFLSQDKKKHSEEELVFTPAKENTVEVFLAQLRLLIGIPDKAQISKASIAPLSGLKPRDWEVDDLLRVRAVEQLTSAKLTLQSLARLLREISNIVITETVGDRITRALALIQSATKKLGDGDLEGGFADSKEAFVISEAAFTDPSLLALLYFPDDQKYAVYIPLFLPVMIPVLFSLRNIKNFMFCRD